MENVPDCDSDNKSCLSLEEETSSDELGELRCSDLDVPLFTSQAFEPLIRSFLPDITDEQWKFLTAGDTDSQTAILLSNVCDQIVNATSALVLKVVAPQVLARMHDQFALDGARSTTDSSARNDRNFYKVTEGDIEASLGNALHCCFGAAMGVAQQKSYESEKLVEMFAADVTRKVNQSLAPIRGPVPFTQPQGSAAELETYASNAEDMISHIVRILRRCKMAQSFEIHYNNSLDSDYSDSSYPDEATDVEDFWLEDLETVRTEEKLTVFLAAFLKKLTDHITESTDTSRLDVDLDTMLSRLRERAEGELRCTLPETVGNIHIPVYKKLCRQFGSAKLLQAAMMSTEGTFEEAVAKILKAQLQKSTRERVSLLKTVRRFFRRRTSKVAPSSSRKNTDTQPAIIKTFSSVARTMRKMFTCCISSGSKDH